MNTSTRLLISQSLTDKFSALSGDFNPIHVDLDASRRSIFGATIVHGMALVFLTLEECLLGVAENLGIQSAKVTFHNSVLVGETISLSEWNPKSIDHEIVVYNASGQRVMTLRLKLSEQVTCEPESAQKTFVKIPPAEKFCSDSGSMGVESLNYNKDLFVANFPAVAKCLPDDTIGFLLALTRIVGMTAPGLHSLFSGFSMKKSTTKNVFSTDRIDWKIKSFHSNFKLLLMEIQAYSHQATLEAFVRPGAVAQISLDELEPFKAKLLSGMSVLVVGGSRGIGEVSAKLAAIMGASVTITYKKGLSEAEELIKELAKLGGKYDAIEFDVTAGPASRLVPEAFDAIIYCASPPIRQKKGKFSRTQLDTYLSYYADGMIMLAEELSGKKPVSIVMPSTVFIDKPEAGYDEYIAAKVASEMIGRSLSGRSPNISFSAPRLPRVLTDQTNSVSGHGYADILDCARILIDCIVLDRERSNT